jgi:cytochrome c oxidase subunit 2
MIRKLGAFTAYLMLGVLLFAGAAYAQQPEPWQVGFQAAADDRMVNINWLHNILLWIIITISLFVLGLLVWIAIRYNEKANPTPSTTTHNTFLEVAWTVIPVLILVVIAVPSFRILYQQDTIPEADFTIKAIGKQWFWTYEYPDHGNFSFDALMIPERRSAPAVPDGEPRLLGASNRVIVPVNATVHLLTTAADVIHSWTIPSFGVKIDAVPGRINEAWFRPTREGVFYGQCSELCGARHAFMPIAVEVVSQERFDAWVSEAQAQFGSIDAPRETRVASDAQ